MTELKFSPNWLWMFWGLGKKLLLFGLSAGLLALSAYAFIENKDTPYCKNFQISFGNDDLCATRVADDFIEREKGLSGVKSLRQDEAILFVFDDNGEYGFWMKDMLISIDIIWLDENKKIVHIEKNVRPETYPIVYYPKTSSRYVLEVSSGVSEKLGLIIGQKVTW